MSNLKILIQKNNLSHFRGGGRYIEILKENLSKDVDFIEDIKEILPQDTLIIPFFDFFQPPFFTKRICKKQILVIFDTIPLKHKKEFPVGIKGQFNLFLNKLNLKNFDQVLTISQHSKQDINKYLNVGLEKIKVIYPILSKIFTKPNEKNIDLNLPKEYLLYVGDVNYNKNLVNLAQAVLKTTLPCVFVGKAFEKKINDLKHPWEKSFLEFLKIHNQNNKFIILGYVEDQQLVNIYKNAKLNLFISHDEGFGYSYLEASSQKCPTLLSDINIFKEISDNNAFYCNSNSIEDIANKINSLINDPNLLKEYGEKAYKRSLFFDSIKFKKEILDLA